MDINYIENSRYKRLYLDDVIGVRSHGLNQNIVMVCQRAYNSWITMLLEAKWRDFSYQLNFWKKENSIIYITPVDCAENNFCNRLGRFRMLDYVPQLFK